MTRPSPDGMYEEMAALATVTHWELDVVLDLEHRDRRRWLALTTGRGGSRR
jgi:hypothetical protein